MLVPYDIFCVVRDMSCTTLNDLTELLLSMVNINIGKYIKYQVKWFLSWFGCYSIY